MNPALLVAGALLFQAGTEAAQPGRPSGATNTITLGGVRFVKVPAGSFAMGDTSGQAAANEQPVHRVTVREFWMASTEVTFGQWKDFLADAGYPAGRSKAQSDKHPVVGISWEDANAYCKWFSAKYGVIMRLPAEAEWEYAARGGREGRQYPNGDAISPSEANYASTAAVAVASYPPNGYGLYDMAGNVFEWTGDWYGKDYYQHSPSTDPRGPATEQGRLQRRADRGGGWCMGAAMLRVSARHAGPGSWDEGGTASCLGFRPVLESTGNSPRRVPSIK